MHDEHLAEILGRRPAASPRERAETVADERMLPDLNGSYIAYDRAANKPVFTLHCILGKDGYRSFQNSHLDSDSQFSIVGNEQVISLRFCNWKIMAVTIRGRNLGRLYDYLHQHRMPWIRRIDPGRDFQADGEPVITAIEIIDVQDAKSGR